MQDNSDFNKNTYLTYCIDKEYYAIDVDQILNIIEYTRVTRLPKAPHYMKGVINIRGEIIPVIDTMKILDLGELYIGARTCILILENKIGNNIIKTGMLVDGVKDVIRINESDLLQNTFLKNHKQSEFITGIVKIQDELVMILDINKLPNISELINYTFCEVENEEFK